MSTKPHDHRHPQSVGAHKTTARVSINTPYRRNSAAIMDRMREQAVAEGQNLPLPDDNTGRKIITDLSEIGLLLGQLEKRWSVTSSLSRPFLEQVGLPYEGRRAGIIYRWPTIFRAEGIPEDVVSEATRIGNPELFEDFLDTAKAAEFLGYRDSSSIRKLIAQQKIPEEAFITFGSRQVYRIRPSALRALQCATIGRIV